MSGGIVQFKIVYETEQFIFRSAHSRVLVCRWCFRPAMRHVGNVKKFN